MSPEIISNMDNNASLDWMRQIQTQQRRCDEENGVLRNLYKRAKAAGENVKAMRTTIRATKLDPDEVIGFMREQVRYMNLRRIPITSEAIYENLDLGINDRTEHAEDIWTAEEAGYRAGRLGAAAEDNPYGFGSEFAQAWSRWLKRGTEARARELGPDETQASTRRQRPSEAKPANGEAAPREGEHAVGFADPLFRAAPKKAARKKSAGRRKTGAMRRRATRSPGVSSDDGAVIY